MLALKDARSKMLPLKVWIFVRRATRIPPAHSKPKRMKENKKRPDRGRQTHGLAENDNIPLLREIFISDQIFAGCIHV
jgi:hypothetical protein